MAEVILWALVWAVVVIITALALFVAAAILSPVVTKLRQEHSRKKNQE